MKLSLTAVLGVAIALATAACGSSRPTRTGTLVSSTSLVAGGAVRCTATLATSTPVTVGKQLSFEFRFHNLTTHRVGVAYAAGPWMIVKGPGGTSYDSRAQQEQYDVGPTGGPIGPGGTMTRQVRVPVRWRGPLRITPGCTSSGLDAIPVDVTSPGLPKSRGRAISDVVAAARHLLDHCRPVVSGVAVVGRIDPPRGDAPPLRARCSVSLRRERGFYLARVLVVTPPNLRGIHVAQRPYEQISIPSTLSNTGPCCGATRNAQGIVWTFVVTRRGATSVDSAVAATTRKASRDVPSGIWTSPRWPERSSTYPCGTSSGGNIGSRGPDVVFVSVCGRSTG